MVPSCSESFPDLQRLAPIVRSHHEEFNGTAIRKVSRAMKFLSLRALFMSPTAITQWSVQLKRYGMTPAAAQQELVKARRATAIGDPTFVQMLIGPLWATKSPLLF